VRVGTLDELGRREKWLALARESARLLGETNTLAAAEQSAPVATMQPPEATMSAKSKRRGRKPKFDAQKDEKLCQDFVASGMPSIKEFARARGLDYRTTDAALKRVRARRSRNKLA
jgi:hypothetical protein